jgi:hypothetical protein
MSLHHIATDPLSTTRRLLDRHGMKGTKRHWATVVAGVCCANGSPASLIAWHGVADKGLGKGKHADGMAWVSLRFL